jgi:hypothetical protein
MNAEQRLPIHPSSVYAPRFILHPSAFILYAATMPPPVTPDDIPRQLAAATAAWSKLRRAASYASFDAWTLAILGVLSLVCGAYSSALGLLISAALLIVAVVEFQSVRRLRRLDPRSLVHLAYNQLALAAALIVYSIVSLIQIAHGGGILTTIHEQLAAAGASGGGAEAEEMVVQAATLLYWLLIAVAIVVQGGTAWFYLSRRKHLENYLAETPAWIQQMQLEKRRGFPVIPG